MESILITGASSGIGAAIAETVAAPGTRLTLWGRDRTRLERVAERCRHAGASVEIATPDHLDLDAVAAAAAALNGMVSEAYLCAGLSDIRPADEDVERFADIRALALVNYVAPALVANSLAEGMLRRGTGRIAMIGSHAAFAPLPVAPSYCASKAGLSAFARALRLDLLPRGVSVTLVSPGFVDSPMSARLDCWKPGMIGAPQAAKAIVRATRRGRGHLVLSPWLLALARLYALAPDGLAARIARLVRVEQSPPRTGASPNSDRHGDRR